MTNRLDMIDEALLRPGRLEVHMEIGLPDLNGRIQILNIHTHKMREFNRLDQVRCFALQLSDSLASAVSGVHCRTFLLLL